MRKWFNNSMVGDALWFLGICLYMSMILWWQFIPNLQVFEWLGPALAPILPTLLFTSAVPIAIGLRTGKQIRTICQDASPTGTQTYFARSLYRMAIGHLLLTLPFFCIGFASLLMQSSPPLPDSSLIPMALLWPGLVYLFTVAASGLMRTPRGMIYSALIVGIVNEVLSGSFLESMRGPVHIIALVLLWLLALVIALFSFRWQRNGGFIGTLFIRKRVRRVFARRAIFPRRLPRDLAWAWLCWGLFALVLPAFAYMRVRHEFAGPGGGSTDWGYQWLWLDPIQFFRLTVVWSSMAGTVMAAWLGVRLGRFARVREVAILIQGSIQGFERKLLLGLAIMPVACLIAALVPATFIGALVNNWMSLPLPRPHEPNSTWVPDMNMLFAKGDAIILRREEAPAVLWIFMLGVLCGWAIRRRWVALILTLVAGLELSQRKIEGSWQELSGTTLSIPNHPGWWAHIVNVCVLAAIAAVLAVVVMKWGLRATRAPAIPQ